MGRWVSLTAQLVKSLVKWEDVEFCPMKWATEDEMVGWHYRLHGHEFEQTLGDSENREAWHAAVHRVSKS